MLAHAFAALLKHEKPLLFPDVTYSFYPVYAQLHDVACETVALDAAMRINVADYRRPAGAIVIANPNAPTGIALPIKDVAALIDAHRDIPVVVDEAYVDFGGESALALLDGRPNLLVVRTMSKSRALAGLRVGYAIGDPGLIEALIRVKDSFNSYPLGRPAQAGAIASVRDEAHLQTRVSDVLRLRKIMAESWQNSGSRSCRLPPILFSPATRRSPAWNGQSSCASAPCSFAISTSRASPTFCASRWGRRARFFG